MVEALVGVDGDIIVVYVDDVFVRLVLDGLVYYLFLLVQLTVPLLIFINFIADFFHFGF